MANAFVLNQLPTTYGQALSLLAEMLFAAGWTYQGSGDGLAGYSAGGKVFTNTTSGAALSWSNPKAWARMQDPAAVREFILQHDNVGGARLKYSAASKFTGGAPSAVVTPSAADERVLRGAGTDAAPTYGSMFNTTLLTLGGCIFQGFARGSAPYGFWFGSIETNGAVNRMLFVLDPLEGAAPEDTDQVVIQIAHTNGGLANTSNMGRAANTLGNWAVVPAPSVEGCWGHMDAARTSFLYVQPYQWTWVGDARAVTGGTVTICIAGAFGGFVNPFNSKYEAMPLLYGRTQQGATPTPGNKGWSTMMRWCGLPRVTFSDTFDSRNWICCGHVWLPWDGITQPRG
jgi:hypothetical protein